MFNERTTQSTAPGERGCPLTCGGPIKMTRDGFARCCAARVELAKEADDFDWNKKQNSRVQISFQDPCLSCQGPPDLLTFIEVPDLQLIGGHHFKYRPFPEEKKKSQPKSDKAKLAEAMHNNWSKKAQSAAKPAAKIPVKPVAVKPTKTPIITPTKEKTMFDNNTLGSLNVKLFDQLDRLSDSTLNADALNTEINRAKAVTEVACQIISIGSLALKAKAAFNGDNAGSMPKMLEG